MSGIEDTWATTSVLSPLIYNDFHYATIFVCAFFDVLYRPNIYLCISAFKTF
jgi:hypothetical protein